MITLNVVVFAFASIIVPAPNPRESAYWSLAQGLPGGLDLLGEVFVRLLVILLNGNTLRYLLIANLAGLIPLLFGGRFIQKFYKFSSYGEALSYLVDAFVVHPDYYLTPQPGRDAEHPGYRRGLSGIRFAFIKDGKLVPGKKNPSNRSIALAGGPGMVIVPPNTRFNWKGTAA